MNKIVESWEINCLEDDLKQELNSLTNVDYQSRFTKPLSFGTGGLRGLMGVGTNWLNTYTIRQATQGIINVLNQNIDRNLKVVIGYDSRINSRKFAYEVAGVFAYHGADIYLFDDLRPTPEVSFAVRELKCDVGIVITASHNPKEYNGYKVYGSDGGQITLELANEFAQSIQQVDPFNVGTIDSSLVFEYSKIRLLSKDFDEKYLNRILGLPIFKRELLNNLKVVYTPLHGSGYELIKKILFNRGYSDVHFVSKQVEPDGNFPTVKSPNPEEKEALSMAIKQAKLINADLVYGTDPDCDRVGVAILHNGQYIQLTGNQIGALLVNYMLEVSDKVDKRNAVIKTIVTSDLGKKIAESYGATVFETLTGFKFIGEKIKEFEESGAYDFLIGYEESYGYLIGNFVRDKDAVIGSLLITEMVAYYKNNNLTLIDILGRLYVKFGYYNEELITITISDSYNIKEIISRFENQEKLIKHFKDLTSICDYIKSFDFDLVTHSMSIIDLPKSDVYKLVFKNGSWIAIRPSGTEPKLKVYISSVAKTKEQSIKGLFFLKQTINEFIL